MKLFTRKSAAGAAPEALIEQCRAAQAEHAAAVTDANQRLVETHDSIFNEAHGRQQVIDEQVKLLRAERDGLDKVKAVANTAQPLTPEASARS